MSDSEHIQKDIAAIRTDVEHLKKMLAFDIAANPQSLARARKQLSTRPNMPHVYLAMENGPKTQIELAAITGISQPTISRITTQLVKHGFVRPIPAPGQNAQIQYTWTDFENLLDLSRVARELVKDATKTQTQDRSSRPEIPDAEQASPLAIYRDGDNEQPRDNS